NDPAADSGGSSNPYPNAPTWTVNRTIKSRSGTAITSFGNSSMVEQYTNGQDVNDVGTHTPEMNYSGVITPTPAAPVRPTVHGDVVHSRPLAVDYGTSYDGVTVFYGSNDGSFRAVSGKSGKERWAFVPPEFSSKLSRLEANSPLISYPNIDPTTVPTPT